MTEKPEPRETKDGSSTLYSNQFKQYYHNPNGAVSESLHVFFDTSGLLKKLNSPRTSSLTIFEIGFGTGLNFILLMDEYKKRNLEFPVRFVSVEGFPISPDTADQLQFKEHLSNPNLTEILPGIFSGLEPGLNSLQPVKELNVKLDLFYGPFRDFDLTELEADFIFHDAFSPEVNAELWTPEVFSGLLGISGSGGILTTYCAASKARASMASAGWKVARARGALGKREMSIASPDPEALYHFKRVNEDRLIQRLKNGDFDS